MAAKDDSPPNLEAGANCVSRLTFNFMSPVVSQGYKRSLEHEDLWELEHRERAEVISEEFDTMWNAQQEPSLISILWKMNKSSILFAAFVSFFVGLVPLAGPVCLGQLIHFLSSDAPSPHGYLWVILLALLPFVSAVLEATATRTLLRVGINMRVSVASAVYKKALRLSATAKLKYESGAIMNLMSNDAGALFSFGPAILQLVTVPLQITVGTALLFNTLGLAAFGGLAVVLLMLPCNLMVVLSFGPAIQGRLEKMDLRVRVMNDIFAGIKVVKLNVYENAFIKRVIGVRLEELVFVKAFRRAMSNIMVLIGIIPSFVFLGAMFMYAALGNSLDIQTIVVANSLFDVLRVPFASMGWVAIGFQNARVSANRVNNFLAAEEDDIIRGDGKRPGVLIKGSFSWRSADENSDLVEVNDREGSDSDEEEGGDSANGSGGRDHSRKVTLQDIDITCRAGTLTMLAGPVGCGKSSVLSAALGFISKIDGAEATCHGSVAYVPQQAWILNGTLRDNIIMAEEFDDEKYQAILQACALEDDLDALVAGDMTEIGEKGINLSGGQKQRVSLARAVYADRDVYFIDDPLSAVDAHVGKHIFDECICGLLSDKLIVMATNQLHVLPDANTIVIMSEDGRVVEKGEFNELMDYEGFFFDFWMENVGNAKEEESDASSDGHTRAYAAQERNRIDTTGQGGAGELMDDEEKSSGAVAWHVYRRYIKAMGGFGFFSSFGLLFLVQLIFGLSAAWFLVLYASGLLVDIFSFVKELTIYEVLGVYTALIVVAAIFNVFKEYFFNWGALRASRRMHDALLRCIMRVPMGLFDTTPTGRIINRFSSDLSTVDTELPNQMSFFIMGAGGLASIVVSMGVALPWLLIAVVPVYLRYYMLQRFFQRTSIALKRLEAVARSPIFAHFSETLDGSECIRAFGLEQEFTHRTLTKFNHHHQVFLLRSLSDLWLKVRLVILGAILTLAAGVAVVLTRGKINVGLASIAVTSAMGLTGLLSWIVQVSTTLEQAMNAAERVFAYSALPSEGALKQDADPTGSWPSRGKITFDRVSMRYRAGLDLVLKDVSFSTKSNEKIGIVGRTGSGKSSLITALFRLVEIEESGRILLDDVDLRPLGLSTVRNALAIIPQDPVLFTGTVRDNVDPFHDYSLEKITTALKLSRLEDVVNDMEDGIESQLAEGGSNLSVGQRQLICLARALLAEPRILVLDEATASVDVETDAHIQAIVRKKFQCTTLTIAHRLNTIMDSDRILVMGDGEILEFDTPMNLLEKGGALKALVQETGSSNARHLTRLARGNASATNSDDVSDESADDSEEVGDSVSSMAPSVQTGGFTDVTTEEKSSSTDS